MKIETIKLNNETLKNVAKEVYNKDIPKQIESYINDNILGYFEYLGYSIEQKDCKIMWIEYEYPTIIKSYIVVHKNGITHIKRVLR